MIKHVPLFLLLCMACQALADPVTAKYPKMASVDQYLMDRQAEVGLAKSAAPGSVSRKAEVLILGRRGFEPAVKGTNGFVCIVGRGWTAAPDAEFWNPKVRVPMCVNAAAARSYLLRVTKITVLALSGSSRAEVEHAMAAAIESKELPPMEPGAMCFMVSKLGYGGDSVPHWPPHLMFFYTDLDSATWGANLKGSPVIAVTDPMEHLTQFVIPVQQWSDGTTHRPVAPHVHASGDGKEEAPQQ